MLWGPAPEFVEKRDDAGQPSRERPRSGTHTGTTAVTGIGAREAASSSGRGPEDAEDPEEFGDRPAAALGLPTNHDLDQHVRDRDHL